MTTMSKATRNAKIEAEMWKAAALHHDGDLTLESISDNVFVNKKTGTARYIPSDDIVDDDDDDEEEEVEEAKASGDKKKVTNSKTKKEKTVRSSSSKKSKDKTEKDEDSDDDDGDDNKVISLMDLLNDKNAGEKSDSSKLEKIAIKDAADVNKMSNKDFLMNTKDIFAQAVAADKASGE